MSLGFSNLTLIHPFISVLNTAPLGHCLRIIHNQIRSPIKFQIKSAVMFWPFLRQHPSKVPVVPVLTLWGCRDEHSCNVLLNEASNMVVGHRAAIWTSAGVKDGQPEPLPRRICGTCHAGVMSKVTSLVSTPGNASGGFTILLSLHPLVEMASRRAGYPHLLHIRGESFWHSAVLVRPTAETSVRQDVLPQVSWPRNVVNSRTCQSSCQPQTAAQLQGPQKRTARWWTWSETVSLRCW